MNEQEWLESSDPAAMLAWANRGMDIVPVPSGHMGTPIARPSDRKLRLFACACCRLAGRPSGKVDGWEKNGSVYGETDLFWATAWAEQSSEISDSIRADILRHIIGSTPFRPAWSVRCERCGGKKVVEPIWHLGPGTWVNCPDCSGRGWFPAPRPHIPADVERLAEAVYEGEDCTFALHDALLEAGMEEMAEHFKTCLCNPPCRDRIDYNCGAFRNHPKGCWAVDAVLGKD